jgi:hypothetical protein
MTQAREPRRWLEVAPQVLPDGFSRALAERRELGPDESARARLWDALEARLMLQPLATEPDRAALRQPRATRATRAWLVGAALLTIAVTALLGVSARSTLPGQARAVDGAGLQRATPAGADALCGGPSVSSEPTCSSSAESSDVPKASAVQPLANPQPSSERPAAAPFASGKRHDSQNRVPRGHRVPAAALAANDPNAELDLLMRARRVVGSDPGRALALTTEHRARYPSGTFVEEREVLAIDALRRLGRVSAASERAQRFHREHPGSVHDARMDGCASERCGMLHDP